MQRTHVFLPEPTLKTLRAEAKRADLSVSEIIRRAIAQYLATHEDRSYLGNLARQVSESISRDNAQKEIIVAENPKIFLGFDAHALACMSAQEATTHVMKKRQR